MSVEKIDRYEIERKLGVGGMAEVFLAQDPYMKRRVALKILPYDLTTKELYQELFQREAEVIAALEHPCIVPIYDFGQYGNQPYFVMRYMRGGSLEDKILEQKMDPRPLAKIVERVADGLDAAHKLGVIHRDVKPSNILFDDDGKALLADFGMAKSLHHSSGQTIGKILGTPEYMSPEQVSNEELDGRSDVYALGVVLYCALTGAAPYRNESPLAIAVAHVKGAIPNILEARPDLEPSWDEVIQKAMAKAREDRYATAVELARDVSEIASGRWFMRKLVD
ncbi:MAG: serine/threonine protein kinase [Anaerolineales bacterium]|nr:serine/threonine protein kinase [Chloroflexota bacterium]MBL6982402.1 serine/threonine protein kinase [Anaerolineales bacterium]